MPLSIRGVVGFVACSVLVTLPLTAQTAPVRDTVRLRLAREVIRASGADSAALYAIEHSLPMQRVANPQIPAEFWDKFLARVQHSLPQLIDSLVPVYAAHFSTAELTQLKAFYATPLGRCMVAELPTLQ